MAGVFYSSFIPAYLVLLKSYLMKTVKNKPIKLAVARIKNTAFAPIPSAETALSALFLSRKMLHNRM